MEITINVPDAVADRLAELGPKELPRDIRIGMVVTSLADAAAGGVRTGHTLEAHIQPPASTARRRAPVR